jgi:hypothetical protein
MALSSPLKAFGSGALPDATWQQAMLRVKDPVPSLKFYRDVLGMTLGVSSVGM